MDKFTIALEYIANILYRKLATQTNEIQKELVCSGAHQWVVLFPVGEDLRLHLAPHHKYLPIKNRDARHDASDRHRGYVVPFLNRVSHSGNCSLKKKSLIIWAQLEIRSGIYINM